MGGRRILINELMENLWGACRVPLVIFGDSNDWVVEEGRWST